MKKNVQPAAQIRRANKDDTGSIAAILYDAFVEHQSAYTPEAFRATTPTAGQIGNRINEGPIWIAVEEDTVVGTVSAVLEGASLYIRSMAVIPAARGQGIGRRLLGVVEEYAVQNGFERLWLSTTPFLTQAIRLYEQAGFSKREERPYELFGTPLITMIKMLRRSV
jgi:ribosomal protein S18 acetylase RimI-like enzyme